MRRGKPVTTKQNQTTILLLLLFSNIYTHTYIQQSLQLLRKRFIAEFSYYIYTHTTPLQSDLSNCNTSSFASQIEHKEVPFSNHLFFDLFYWF